MPYSKDRHHRRSIRLKGYDYSKAGLYFITICVHNRKCSFGEIVGAGFTPAPNINTPAPNINTPAPNINNPALNINAPPSIITGQPSIITGQPSIIAGQPPIITGPPSIITGPPSIITGPPPIITGQPPIITGQPQGFAPTDARMELNDFGNVAYEQWEKLPERFSNFELDVFQIMPNHMHGIILLNDNINGVVVNGSGMNGSGVNPAPTIHPPTIGDIVGAYKSLVANECLEQFKLNRPNEMMGKLWQRNYHEHIIRDQKSYQHISKYIINNPQNWKDDKFYNE